MFSLCLCQSPFFYSKEFRISYCFASGERGEGFQPAVYADCVSGVRQALRLDFCREASEPLTRRTAPDSQRLDFALDRSMQLDLDSANFRGSQLAMLDSKAGLWKGEAIVSGARAKAGKACLFAGLHTPEECVKGFIQSPQRVLQNLRVNRVQFWANPFYLRQLVLLMFVADGLVSHAPGISALLQSGVIQLTAESKPASKRGLLSAARIDSILVCSLHLPDSLQFAYYNFCQLHSSLRITLAMKAGLTDPVWTLSELLRQ